LLQEFPRTNRAVTKFQSYARVLFRADAAEKLV